MANVATTTAGWGEPGSLPSAPSVPELCPSRDTGWQRRPCAWGDRFLTLINMNENHATLCASPEWVEHIQVNILPALAAGLDLGETMLEIGPGPGAATEWLRSKVRRLVALEVDAEAAEALSTRLAGTNVEIVSGDAAALEYADESFDSVACFTMLHHVPTVSLQNRLLAEVLRVLRPGGVFIGADSLASDDLHHFHVEDTYNPVEVGSFLPRLQTIGFEKITLIVDGMLSFIAHKTGGHEGEASCD
jgi:SAM-dependent methyltransferase